MQEKHVNRLQRQLETLLGNYRVLEKQLEAAGVPLQQLPVRLWVLVFALGQFS